MKKIIYIFLYLLTMQQIMAQSTAFKKVLDDHITQTVPLISVDSLNKNDLPFTILDAREKTEFEISHIKNAIWVGYDSFNLSQTIKKIDKSKPVVVYCSIGYRSEKIGEQLQKKGYKVYNLYGGIFHWTNQGFKVVDETNKPTLKVHGYDKNWGKWLTKAEVVYGK